MYFVQDNKTDVSYDNNTVKAALDTWKCTDELSCICCQKCESQDGGHHGGSSQEEGPPNTPIPLICSSVVCPAEEGQGAGQHGGSKGKKGRRRKRSSQNPPPNGNDGGQHGWGQQGGGQQEGGQQGGGQQGGGQQGGGQQGGGQPGEGGEQHGEDGGQHGEDGGDLPPEEDGEGEHGIDDIAFQTPEADPDFKTNAEFLQLLMRLDEDTRERIGHKYVV